MGGHVGLVRSAVESLGDDVTLHALGVRVEVVGVIARAGGVEDLDGLRHGEAVVLAKGLAGQLGARRPSGRGDRGDVAHVAAEDVEGRALKEWLGLKMDFVPSFPKMFESLFITMGFHYRKA